MALSSLFSFGRRGLGQDVPEAQAVSGGVGPITGCDLSALDSLTKPFATDPFYRLRPPFSPEAAALSLELAGMTYTLELEPWAAAGWTDFSVLIDDSLHAGLSYAESGEGLGSLVSQFRLMRAKADLRQRNPVSQLISALRQREKSDTIKAVCMMHPAPDGRFVLAIGFMGTGTRFYDWFSNFRFTTEEGFHKGFYQLCDCFEQNAESIDFPSAAAALGLERLTLGQVLLEMRSLSSRFRLWMAGHSQGGAVMQVFAHRLMNDWGVLAQNMVGYGFASPTAATGQFVYDPAAYPLFHIFNSDDLVPRMGALLHLGLCLEYPADQPFRDAAYGLSRLQPDEAAYAALVPFHQAMTDTPACVLHVSAFLTCLAEEKGEDALNALIGMPWAIPLLDRMFQQAGDRAASLLERIHAGLQAGYVSLTGAPMNEAALAELQERMRPLVHSLPARRLLTALIAHALPPHMMVLHGRPDRDGAYAAIVKTGLASLRPFIWRKQPGALPFRHWGNWPHEPAFRTASVTRARRGERRSARRTGKIRRMFS